MAIIGQFNHVTVKTMVNGVKCHGEPINELKMDNIIPILVGKQNIQENNSSKVSCLLEIHTLNLSINLNGPLK